MSVRVFPLIQEDKDLAMEKAQRIVDYYSKRREKQGKRVGLDREHNIQLNFVGYCAENAIRRILHGRVGEGEEFGSDWDMFIPGLGYLQVKSTHIHGRNPFPVSEPRNIEPEHLVWLTYYRQTDIQTVRELTWGEVLECPKKDDGFHVPISAGFWARVQQ